MIEKIYFSAFQDHGIGIRKKVCEKLSNWKTQKVHSSMQLFTAYPKFVCQEIKQFHEMQKFLSNIFRFTDMVLHALAK